MNGRKGDPEEAKFRPAILYREDKCLVKTAICHK